MFSPVPLKQSNPGTEDIVQLAQGPGFHTSTTKKLTDFLKKFRDSFKSFRPLKFYSITDIDARQNEVLSHKDV